MKEAYSIGLDIGTASVGWAVINQKGELLRHKHQNMAGSHLFSSAQTAAARRGFRSSRRRMARRKQRILQLQMLLDPIVSQVDPAFFARMKESMLIKSDKTVDKIGNILFSDADFTDADYRKKYPTIYHLRKDLVESKDKKDIRLIYLALHHIIKYRGHFLYEGQSFAPGDTDDAAVREYFSLLDEFFGGQDFEIHADAIIDTLTRNDLNASTKAKEIAALFKENSQAKKLHELAKLMVGLQANVANLGEVDYENKGFAFSDTDYEDEKRPKLESAFGDDFVMIDAAEAVYKWSLLQSVLKNNQFISQAMVESYDEYRKDLSALKKLFKKFAPAQYRAFFWEQQPKGVVCYTNYEERGNIKNKDLVAHIRGIFKDNLAAQQSPEYERFEARTNLESFLQKQRIRDNGAIPNQIHCNELTEILDNQSTHHPELDKLKDKLKSIASFRIPYHVGPLKTGGDFAWAVKKSDVADQKVYPWNFSEIIDIDKSAEAFITKMRNFCTYLPDEEVLPKCSLLYAEFELWNELKSVRVNDNLLGIDVQKRVVEELFYRQKTVSHAAFKKWLLAQGIFDKIESVSGTAQETKFSSSLGAQIDFTNMGLSVETHREMIEEIIKWITLFEDKKVLKSRLKSLGNKLTDEQKKDCLKLRYSGWGRLSRRLLDGLREDCGLYGSCTVMDILRQDAGAHFMKIIDSENYPFKKRIAQFQHEAWGDRTEIVYDNVDKLAGSPAIKRGIWRSIRIVNEIVEIMGYAPTTINIEMARNEDEKKRTVSRQRQLLKQYETFIKLADDYNKARAKELKKQLSSIDDKSLRSKRLYLYFLQNGKCAYTGKDLEINNLSYYDMDHIIPRALLKDDSFSNMVLVLQGENREKSNDYPLRPEIIEEMRGTWKMWRDAKLMDDIKFRRLTRLGSLEEGEIAGFINRQIVETRQITKHVARMLGEQFRNDKTSIRTIRAGLASEYRRIYNLPKCRELNDFHHAKDAYLAAVIGEFLSRRYPGMDKNSFYDAYKRFQKMRTSALNPSLVVAEMGKDVIGAKPDEYAWTADEMNRRIERTMGYNDVLVTRMTETSDGQFYDQSALKKGAGRAQIHENMPIKDYGGYGKVKSSGLVIVKYELSNGKTVKRLVGIPVYVTARYSGSRSEIERFLINTQDKAVSAEVIGKNMGFYQKILYNKGRDSETNILPVYITGATEFVSAKQITLSLDKQRMVYEALHSNHMANSSELCDKVYLEIIDKILKHVPIFMPEAKTMAELTDKYKSLGSQDKIEVLKRIFKAISARSYQSNFKVGGLNLGSSFGRKQVKNIDVDKIDFIYESITGLRKRIVKGKDL